MRILLTGKTGQLGRALAATLPSHGDVVAPSRENMDLLSEPSIRKLLNEARPNLIVNAAAYTAVDNAESDRDTAMAVNAHAPGVIAEWAALNDAAILHYSTDYVFDGTERKPWRELDPVSPVNTYGETKHAGERAIIESGAAHLIIRTSWLYDASGSNFLRTILRLARERTQLQIVDDQIGAPTPARWLSDISTRIISEPVGNGLFQGSQGGLLHAAPAGHTSWYGFACSIVDGARKRALPLTVKKIEPIPSSAYPMPAKRPYNSVFCLDRLEKNFGIKPPHWSDALLSVLDEVAQNEK